MKRYTLEIIAIDSGGRIKHHESDNVSYIKEIYRFFFFTDDKPNAHMNKYKCIITDNVIKQSVEM